MEMKLNKKHVEVQFVADKDVVREIVSIKDLKAKRRGNAFQGKKSRKRNESGDSEKEDDSLCKDLTTNEKPTELFEAGDVPGHQMFGFHTPKGKGALTPRTPQSKRIPYGNSGTPRAINSTPKTSKHVVETAKTPYSLRRRLKNNIARTARYDADDKSDWDFSASESDYIPTDSESSEPSEEESDENEPLRASQTREESKLLPRRERKLQDMEYVLRAEEFFTNQKSVTSDHTLSRLQQPRLAEKQLRKILEDMTLSHQEAVFNLCAEHVQFFDKWMFLLGEGYSVVLYGLGSKRHTLQQFHVQKLQDQRVLEVNGFFPSLTIKEIVDSIVDELLELSDCPVGMLECLEAIESELCSELFLIVHNLDGPMLQSEKSQDVLSRLARMQYVHLLASIDHINAPLIWDEAKLSRYNFVWWDVTSMQPYAGETQFENSLLVQQSGGLALSSLSNVFHSLTSNARSIFIIMVRHQLNHHKDPTYLGMPFKDLYWSAREALLVSSDLALRAQLTEFLDHRLVRQRRSHDGLELLQIPVDRTVLQRFLEQVEEET